MGQATDGLGFLGQRGDTLWYAVPIHASVMVSDAAPDRAYSAEGQWQLSAWERAGLAWRQRVLFVPAYANLPEAEALLHATLEVHALNGSAVQGTVPAPAGDNRSTLQRLETSWSPGSISWNSQPQGLPEHAVFLQPWLPEASGRHIDCTALIQMDLAAWQSAAAANGFVLQLQSETPQRSLALAGDQHPEQDMRPRLLLAFRADAGPGTAYGHPGPEAAIACGEQGFTLMLHRPGAYAWTVHNTAGQVLEHIRINSQGQEVFRGSGLPTPFSIQKSILALGQLRALDGTFAQSLQCVFQ